MCVEYDKQTNIIQNKLEKETIQLEEKNAVTQYKVDTLQDALKNSKMEKQQLLLNIEDINSQVMETENDINDLEHK